MHLPADVPCPVPYVTSPVVILDQRYPVGHKGLPQARHVLLCPSWHLSQAVFISVLLCLFVSSVVCLLRVTIRPRRAGSPCAVILWCILSTRCGAWQIAAVERHL